MSDMNEYKIVKITDLGTVNRGKSKHRPRNDSILYGGEYPFIQTGDVKKANLHLIDYTQTYNDVGLKQSKLWKKGTLCFTIAANIADSAILGMDACFPDSIVGFLPYENVSDTTYVKYLFDELKLYFQQISKGTTQDNLSLGKICRVKLRVPDYDTQVKVASILSTYDTAIENNNKRIRLLEQMAENLYKEWFVRFRFPGYEDVEFENGIPKGWKVGRLSDILTLQSGYAFKSENFVEKGEYKIVTIKNVQHKIFDGNNVSYLDSIPVKMPKYCALHTGDLLLSLTGNVGRVCRVVGENYLLNQRVAKIKTDYKYYAYSLLTTQQMFNYMNNLANGTAQLNLSPIKTENIRSLLPNIELIEQYDKLMSPYFNEIMSLNQQTQLLTKERDFLLPRLMSGKLEV